MPSAAPHPSTVTYSRPDPPPVSWTFLSPLLDSTFFDAVSVANAVSSQFHMRFPSSSSDRSASPASVTNAVTLSIHELTAASVKAVALLAGKC